VVEWKLLFSFKMFFFRRHDGRMQQRCGAQPARKNRLDETTRRRALARAAALSCPPASCRGAFPPLAEIVGREKTDATSPPEGESRSARPKRLWRAYGPIRRKVQPESLCSAKMQGCRRQTAAPAGLHLFSTFRREYCDHAFSARRLGHG
jgi:hypothetical protein